MNSGRKRDLPYEALAESTDTDMNAGRGELNSALRSIKEQAPGLDPVAIADEIRERARLYRRVWPDITLTAPSLAKHWKRVWEENSRTAATVTNRDSGASDCATCGGDKFVLVATRPPVRTIWMEERGIEPRENEGIEEYAACPDCSTVDTSHFRYDGTRAQALDPARVRELISRA